MVAYSSHRSRLVAYGRWEYPHPAAEIVAHLQPLVDAGRSRRWIARQAGVSDLTIGLILNGVTRTVQARTARRLLRVTLESAPTGTSRVDATATRRRVQALGAMGWSLSVIAGDSGVTVAEVSAIRNGHKREVFASTAEAIGRVYDARSMIAPSGPAAERARAEAARRGFAPPLAWDDDTIDNPKARPRGLRRMEAA